MPDVRNGAPWSISGTAALTVSYARATGGEGEHHCPGRRCLAVADRLALPGGRRELFLLEPGR